MSFLEVIFTPTPLPASGYNYLYWLKSCFGFLVKLNYTFIFTQFSFHSTSLFLFELILVSNYIGLLSEKLNLVMPFFIVRPIFFPSFIIKFWLFHWQIELVGYMIRNFSWRFLLSLFRIIQPQALLDYLLSLEVLIAISCFKNAADSVGSLSSRKLTLNVLLSYKINERI